MVNTELMKPTPARIVLASKRGDSINRISDKIDVSYSWVYDWVERLEREDIISIDDSGVGVVDYEIRRRYYDMMAALYRRGQPSQEEAYVVPHFAGTEFAYTEIDAAYVWTSGGYQIARSHDDYPVFLKIHSGDLERWMEFFHEYGLKSSVERRIDQEEVDGAPGVYYVLFPVDDGIDIEWIDGNPVTPLDETVDMMVENRAAYEPALEMIADEHDVEMDIDPAHRAERTGKQR